MVTAKLQLLQETFENKFDIDKFKTFTREFFNEPDMLSGKRHTGIWREYENSIISYSDIAKFKDANGNNIIVFAVELKSEKGVERARSLQRNFISKILDQQNSEAAIVAFYSDKDVNWRLSFVRLDYTFKDKGLELDLTPAKRYSYLVGENETSHTAQKQLYPIFEDDKHNPTLDEIEAAFSVEKVTKDFFEQYKNKYYDLKEYLEKDEAFINETKKLGFEIDKFSEQFAKKLMGQLAFLYFIQKKGWLGVRIMPEDHSIDKITFMKIYDNVDNIHKEILKKLFVVIKDGKMRLSIRLFNSITEHEAELLSDCFIDTKLNMPWGSGNKKFIREIFDFCINNSASKNFFDDYLEPFFYDALNKRRKNQYYKQFNCKIPFLNGGLFEPLEGYHWIDANFEIPDKIFSNVKEKGRDADGILDIFDRYNFTMNEDEPLEKEVAVDPEMLGKIFENLLDGKDRKAKGAFYTPREIVHYMCQESLTNYLVNEVNVPYEDMKEFILYGELIRDADNRSGIANSRNFNDKKTIKQSIFDKIVQIDEALKNIRVADPAVGSGAFPLGMLNEIVRARNNITEYLVKLDKNDKLDRRYGEKYIRYNRSQYEMKWKTIKNSIFAVDIEPSAVDIAKLRLWLSVVVEQEIDDENPEPHPLPNLDCNIMVGNSLIDEYEGIKLFDESLLHKYKNNNSREESKTHAEIASTMQLSMLIDDSDNMLKEMFELQDRLFNEDEDHKKKEIKAKIDKIRDDLIKYKLTRDGNREGINKYREMKKLKMKPFFIWELEFAKVFKEKGGFDVVVGNPPYVGEKGNKKIFHDIKNTDFGKMFYQRRMDLFYFFMAKGVELLKSKGTLSFITTNYWITASGGQEKFRPYLKEMVNILKYIDFGEYKIFDSALGQHNSIFLFEKNLNDKNKKANVIKIDDYNRAKDFSLSEILRQELKLDGILKFNSQGQNEIYDEKTYNIHFNNNSVFDIIEKIQKKGETLLGKLCTISGGVSSSADKVRNANLKYCSMDEQQMSKINIGDGILVIDYDEVAKLDFSNKEMMYIKPYFKSSEIEKYITNNIPSKYLVYATHNNADEILQQEKIYKHLCKYKSILENRSQDIELERAMQKGYWFVLTNGRNKIDFNQPKIVCPYRTKDNVFGYNEVEWYAGRDVYYLVDVKIDIKFLLGLLNSKFIKFWLEYKGKRKGDIYEIYPEPLKNIPIVYSDKETIEKIAVATDKILEIVNEEQRYYGNTREKELLEIQEQINCYIYKLYNLSHEEIDFINEL